MIPQKISTVFLDRDGVINKRPGLSYVTKRDDFEFLPGVREAVAEMTAERIQLFVITNQRGIAHGLMSHDDLTDIHAYMKQEIKASGGSLAEIYYCPHHPDQCDCKKPKPGMLHQAKRNFPEVDFKQSVIIGDSLRDIQAGWAVQCPGIVVGPQDQRLKITAELDKQSIPWIGSVDSLYEAVKRFILPHHVRRNASVA